MDPTRTFIIDRCLGRGGFGEVYRARMTRQGGMERVVALKVLRRDIDPDGQAVRRLRDEGRLLATLNHPTILKVHDLVLLDDRIALITEFVDGEDLTACMAAEIPMSSRGLVAVLAQVAGAIEAAWSTHPASGKPLRMVHRDIKPSNIRVSRHGEVKLLDFGIARTDSVDRESRTRTGMLVGSPAYMAPERFLEHSVLVESDVFSVGAVLFEGVVGERFYGTLPLPMQVGLAVAPERYRSHLAEQLERVDSPQVRELLQTFLVFEPEDRPSPAEVQTSLTALADALRGPTLQRWCRQRVWVESAEKPGELEGRTIKEGLLAPPQRGSLSASLVPGAAAPAPTKPSAIVKPTISAVPPFVEQEPDPPTWPLLMGAAIGLVGIGLGSLFVGSSVFTTVLLYTGGTSEQQESVETTEVAALPVEVPVSPPPAPEPAPARPSEPPARAPLPTPVAVVETVEEPPPPPVDLPFGQVRLTGIEVAFAVSDAGRVRLPARLLEGVYDIEASFNGAKPLVAGTITVHGDAVTTVACSARMERCSQR